MSYATSCRLTPNSNGQSTLQRIAKVGRGERLLYHKAQENCSPAIHAAQRGAAVASRVGFDDDGQMQPDEYEIMFRLEETHWWYRAAHRLIFDALEKELPDWRDKEILDVGCGTGWILKQLGNPEKNMGIDLAHEATSFCHQRGLNNVRQADICALPFASASFDAVICSSVLYHGWVKDVTSAIRELHRVLRAGGLLLLNVPAFRFLHSAHDEAVMTARRFRKKEIRSLLVENGFMIRRLTYWTTLLFPLAVLARTFGGSKMGRDFPPPKFSNYLFAKVMSLEHPIVNRVSLPFGVALFATARKQGVNSRDEI